MSKTEMNQTLVATLLLGGLAGPGMIDHRLPAAQPDSNRGSMKFASRKFREAHANKKKAAAKSRAKNRRR